MSRTEAREILMQLLFQMDAQQDCSNELKELMLSGIHVPPQHLNYVTQGFDSVTSHLDVLDQEINRFADRWTTGRMPRTDLAILRLAAAEIMFIQDIPGPVAIDEAVEMAKKYGCDGSPRFVNGVLGKILRQSATKATNL